MVGWNKRDRQLQAGLRKCEKRRHYIFATCTPTQALLLYKHFQIDLRRLTGYDLRSYVFACAAKKAGASNLRQYYFYPRRKLFDEFREWKQ